MRTNRIILKDVMSLFRLTRKCTNLLPVLQALVVGMHVYEVVGGPLGNTVRRKMKNVGSAYKRARSKQCNSNSRRENFEEVPERV